MSIGRTEFTSGLRVVTERMPGVRSPAPDQAAEVLADPAALPPKEHDH